jgi:hypothetical protein
MASKKTSRRRGKASGDAFASWKGLINWKKRVKAVCKPCWEIKYCPYGPLVEQFPLKEEPDSQSCRIFGHDCPVFHVAEPFTETRELRKLSRDISRPTQFRVLKRENQICSVCAKNVQDGDIHFDHIIPYSKGGSSDESNIRLLCDSCNSRKSDRFEDENLVVSAAEHLQKPLDISFVMLLLDFFVFAHEFRKNKRQLPNAKEISKEFSDGKVTAFEERIQQTFSDFAEFFETQKPKEITRNQFQSLKTRWGYDDGFVYKLASIADEFGEPINDLIVLERTLLSRVGWYVEVNKFVIRSWSKL